MTESDSLTALRVENARLIALLEAHGLEWRIPSDPVQIPISPSPLEPESSNLSTDEKIALFRRLFRGRSDLYPILWESKKTGKSGYAPACANEWRSGMCDKPRIKCSNCGNRLLKPLTDAIANDILHFPSIFYIRHQACTGFRNR